MFVETRQPRSAAHFEIAERRESSRHNLSGIAEVCAPGFPPVVGTIGNLSLGGCFVVFRHLLPINYKVTVHLNLHSSSVAMTGVVCRQEWNRGFAIRFCA